MESYGDIFSISDGKCKAFARSYSSSRAFSKAFTEKYRYIKGYHATRLSNEEIRDIRKGGLKISSISMLESKAVKRFVHPNDTIELEAGIRSEIHAYLNSGKYRDGGRLFFNLVKKDFDERPTQYLVFGAETLIGLANHLSSKFPIRFTERLRQFGQAYIIHSVIQSTSVKKCFIKGIYKYIHGDQPESCIVSYQDLAPSDILRIQHIANPNDEYFWCI